MKKINADHKWIALIGLVLIAEVLWLFADLQWIEISFLSKKTAVPQVKEAGYIISSQKDLKRRGANSLVWEETSPKDVLFYHDSILTLSQSSAKLYLKDQTDLELSENTLVTLEEPTDKTSSEIRLRFSKGDLRARNPSFKTSVVGDEWVINLDKGSDIKLRKDFGSYEFEVVSGSAKLQTQFGEQDLKKNKILKLNEDHQIKSVEKNENLKWKETKPLRIYTLATDAEIPLEWSGNAENLIINKSGQSELSQKINSKTTSVKLEFGSYNIRLKDQQGVSESKTVQVLKAPHIFLKKPLPRDRLKTNESQEFVWTSEKGIKTYYIEFLENGILQRKESSTNNYKSLKFEREQNLNWQVMGQDEDGFTIPSLYKNEIYFRDQPLQAPKLKAPDIKSQSSESGAFYKPSKFEMLWSLLITTAEAKMLSYEIYFSWEPVTGANQYILEISSNPDFRNPEVVKTLTSTSYRWKQAKYKKYYWRVASGNARGQMGLFSEAMELQLEDVKISKSTPALETKVEKPTSQIKNVALETRTEPLPEIFTFPEVASGFGFSFAPSYKYSKNRGADNTEIDLQGFVPLGFQLTYQSNWIQESNYQASLWLSQQTWKPDFTSDDTSQPNLKIRQSFLTIDRQTLNHKLIWGLVAHENFISVRKSSERVEIQQQLAFGIRISRIFTNSYEWQSKAGLSLLKAGQSFEAMVDFEARKYFLTESKRKLSWGVGVNSVYQTHPQGRGLQTDLIFLIGLEQF